jgi:PadR family transcriptional regulator PadR
MVIPGTLELLILQTLRWGPRHGYAINQAIRSGSHDVFQVETGSLYPTLQRLEKRGLVKAEWRTSDNNQQARFYRMTPQGRKFLTAEQSRWDAIITAFRAVMQSREQEG